MTKGTVGVTFKLIDQASKTFENIALKGRKTQEEIEKIGRVSQTANKHMKNLASGTQKAMDRIKSTAIKTTAVIGGLSVGLMKCAEASAELQAMTSTFNQVFGSLSKDAQKGLDGIAKKTGIVSNRLKTYYTQIGAFAKSTGLTDAEALDVAQRGTLVSADLSAFWDRDISEMSEAVQSYLKGNFSNDARLGFSSTEATRNAMAQSLYKKNYKDLTEQEKQLTLLAQIEKASRDTGAYGQAQREADSYLNQLGNMKQSWIDIQATIGEAFLPTLVESFKEISEYLQENKDTIRDVANSIGSKITPAVKWIVENLDKVVQMGKVVGALWIGGKAFGMLTPLVEGATRLIPQLQSVYKWLKEIAVLNSMSGGLGTGTKQVAKSVGKGATAGASGTALAGAGATAGGLGAVASVPLAMFGAGFGGVKAIGKMYGWDVDYSNKGFDDYAQAQSRGARRLKTHKDTSTTNSTSVSITVQGNLIGNKSFMEQTGRYVAQKIQMAMANSK